MSQLLSRRQVLRGGGLIAVGLATPKWLGSIAHADLLRLADGGKATGDTVLVVCQLTGGNDGLNTVIPYGDSAYYSLRPNLGVPDGQVLKLNEHMGLHPSLSGLRDLYQKGRVAIIQNVGYPRPNRSHFRSMEIWQSASPDGALKHGWVGRMLDLQQTRKPQSPIVGLGLSTEKPLALDAASASVPCFASLSDVQGMIGDPDAEKMLRQIQGGSTMEGSATRAVQQAGKSALDAMSILKKQLGQYTPTGQYGKDSFGNGFRQIAQIIATSPATRVVYFSAGGFDTHARQPETHAKLLKSFGDAVQTFQNEIEALGRADKVVLLVFSEFGRRASENASLGTDHGAAAPMFLIGKRVKGGLHGPVPDLKNLQDGDVKFTTDFREVYAATLDQWMGTDSGKILGQKFNDFDIFA